MRAVLVLINVITSPYRSRPYHTCLNYCPFVSWFSISFLLLYVSSLSSSLMTQCDQVEVIPIPSVCMTPLSSLCLCSCMPHGASLPRALHPPFDVPLLTVMPFDRCLLGCLHALRITPLRRLESLMSFRAVWVKTLLTFKCWELMKMTVTWQQTTMTSSDLNTSSTKWNLKRFARPFPSAIGWINNQPQTHASVCWSWVRRCCFESEHMAGNRSNSL